MLSCVWPMVRAARGNHFVHVAMMVCMQDEDLLDEEEHGIMQQAYLAGCAMN